MRLSASDGGDERFLRGARVALGARQAEWLDLTVGHGLITSLARPSGQAGYAGARVVPLEECLVVPGLVNAHDHLEFSLFPRLGAGPFRSARQWAESIYRPAESPICEQLQLDHRERLIWGGLKNLISGVTTVCHHNPYEPEAFERGFPVRVVSRFGWAHSLDFSDDVAERFAATPDGQPFLLHLGEATDEGGRREVFALDAMGALDRRTVLVHGVALGPEGLALAERRGAAVVWCPSSNLFTLGATVERAIFDHEIRIALATDSALTGEGDLLDELRVAHRLGLAGRERLYEMVTTEAAAVLRLDQGEGRVAEGSVADLTAFADREGSPCEVLTSEEPPELLLVMVGGEVKLVAERFAGRLDPRLTSRLERIRVAGRGVYLVDADVRGLAASARGVLGPPIRLAGKVVEE
jgi:cytosine/adenosine deaminase-related metal-dependent hydrolase